MLREIVLLALSRGVNMILSIVLLLQLTNILSAASYGEYAYIIALVALMSPLTIFGMQTLMLKKIAAKASSNTYTHIFLALLIILLTFYLSGALVIILVLAVLLNLKISSFIIFFCIAGTAIVEIVHAFFQAIRKSWFSSLFVTGFRQLSFIFLIFICGLETYEQAIFYYLLSSFIALAPILRHIVRGANSTLKILTMQRKRIWRIAKANRLLPGIYFAQVQWGGLIGLPFLLVFLGSILEPTHLATYALASKLVGLVSFVLTPINRVFAPRFVKIFNVDRRKCERLVQFTYTVCLFSAIPFACFFLIGGEIIEYVFPQEYSDLSLIIGIMATAQVMNCITGPVVWILQLSGNEKLLRWIIIASNLFALFFTWVLITFFQMSTMAGAMGFLLMLVVPNMTAIWFANRRLKIVYGLRIKTFLSDMRHYG